MEKTYMRDNLQDDWGILPLQDKILEIMVYLDEFCLQHNIEYFLMGGSALGAKRHGGFIPWDDDLDIFMTPKNYDKFRVMFKIHGNTKKYYLQEWAPIKDDIIKIAKFRMNNTTYLETALKHKDIHHGIFVDIFLLHNCPSSKIKQVNQYLWAKYVVLKGLSDRNYSRRHGLVAVALKLFKLLPKRFGIQYGLKQVYKYNNEKTDLYCNFLGRAKFRKGIYKKEWFGKGIYLPFEKIRLKVPEKLEDFLLGRFGNYIEIPSLEKIKWEQHAEQWDVDRDFRSYVDCISNFSDEKDLY